MVHNIRLRDNHRRRKFATCRCDHRNNCFSVRIRADYSQRYCTT